ncbi:MAG: hypothetical protein HND58_06980 [Planctomycetota bacterium]|nr:MAG: hypothetical protein HND58_06980 [Planctomycetota bacterium]
MHATHRHSLSARCGSPQPSSHRSARTPRPLSPTPSPPTATTTAPSPRPPVGNGSFGVAGDALPDGRLLMVTGNSVFLESSAGSAVFNEVALLDETRTGGSTDPAFLTVSPDGQRIAIGTGFGKPVAVFQTSALGTPNAPTTLTSGTLADYFAVGHYDGTWFDNTSLALTAGEFGQPSFVSMLDTTSTPHNPLNETVVTNILGGSAGIAFDSAGRLYTANGFAYGTGSDTGNIRAFEPADWINGADFESDGTLIGDILSGNAAQHGRRRQPLRRRRGFQQLRRGLPRRRPRPSHRRRPRRPRPHRPRQPAPPRPPRPPPRRLRLLRQRLQRVHRRTLHHRRRHLVRHRPRPLVARAARRRRPPRPERAP